MDEHCVCDRSWRARCERLREEALGVRLELREAESRAALWAKRDGAAEAPVSSLLQGPSTAGALACIALQQSNQAFNMKKGY